MIHSGSRGCGHQICADYLRTMDKAYKTYNINLPDRQLACAPVDSDEAQDYFKAMAGAANYAWTNRQMIVHWVRESFEEVFKRDAEDMNMGIFMTWHTTLLKKNRIPSKGRKLKFMSIGRVLQGHLALEEMKCQKNTEQLDSLL